MTSREPLSAESPSRQYQFGEFVLDLHGGFLRRHGREVALRRKAFDVLTHLVLHHNQLVSKDELAKAAWPDTAVTDNSLSQCPPEPVCPDFCDPQWAPDGRFLYLSHLSVPRTELAKTLVIPLEPGQMLPRLPPGASTPSLDAIPGAYQIDGEAWTSDYRVAGLSPSLDPAVLAYVKVDVPHNIFRTRFR